MWPCPIICTRLSASRAGQSTVSAKGTDSIGVKCRFTFNASQRSEPYITPDEFEPWARAESRAHSNRLADDPDQLPPHFDLSRSIAVFEGSNIGCRTA